MKIMKTVPVPATTRNTLDYVKCELCENTSTQENWSPEQYDVTEPKVTLRLGTSYPEGGNTVTTTLDICPRCFQEKLIPWFKSLGGEPRTHESDW